MRKKGGMKHRGGGGGRRYHGGGGGGGGRNDHQNIARQKHHAMQMREKYSNMARDAQINGDRSDVEYYLQHVDHYSRVLADIAVIEAERQAQFRDSQPQPSQPQDGGDNGSQGSNDAPDDNQAGGQSSQPRMTRRHHHGGGQQQQGNTNAESADPNANKTEIPLPGSILPAI